MSPSADASSVSHRDRTRASLISRARLRDSQAWHELVDLYGPLVAYWCHRSGMDAHGAADCVQEVFAAVSRSLGSFRPQRSSGAFRSWLWTITANKVKDAVRRSQRNEQARGGSTALGALEQLADAVDESASDCTSPDQLQQLAIRGLKQVRGEFEPRSWKIFERAVIDEVPTAIVAAEFGVQPAAVRQIRSRILRRLRQQLGDLD